MTMTARPAAVGPEPAPEQREREVALALRDSTAVGLGLFPIGVAFGVLVVHSGLPWWWAVLCTAFVYAGSLEFLLVGLVVAAVPLAQIALTTFLVNFRHVFYALSFPLHRIPRGARRAYGAFAMTDEAYALTAGGNPGPSGRRIVWLQLFCQAYWVGGAALGASLGTLIPDGVVGLEFALTALFVVLAIDACRAGRDVPTPVLALLCALVALALFPGRLLVTSMALFTSGLLLRYALRRRRRPSATEYADA